MATDGGLVRFDPKGRPGRRVHLDKAARRLPMFTSSAGDDDRRGHAITVLREARDGTIWVGTDNGSLPPGADDGRHRCSRLTIQLPSEYPEQRIIADVVEDARGSLWIAAPSGLYRRWPDGSAARYTVRDGLPHDYLSDLFEDHAGHLWAGTRLERLLPASAPTPPAARRLVDTQSRHRSGYATVCRRPGSLNSSRRPTAIPGATTEAMAEFFSTERTRARTLSSLYRKRNGLSDHGTSPRSTKTSSGNLWLGTTSAGAMKLTRGGFTTYGEAGGHPVSQCDLRRSCRPRSVSRGSVLGDARTSVFDGATARSAALPMSAGIHARFGCFDGQRFDWFMPEAVSRIRLGRGARHAADARRRMVDRHRRGAVPLSAGRDFAHLKTARPLGVYTMKDGLAGLQVFRLFEDSRGNVWVSTIRPDTARPRALGTRPATRARPGRARRGWRRSSTNWPARSFAEDGHGNVWIGFDSELARLQAGHFHVSSRRPTACRRARSRTSTWTARAGSGSRPAQSGLIRVDDAGGDATALSSATRPRRGCRATTPK